MKLAFYLRDKILIITLNILGMLLLCFYLLGLQNTFSQILLIPVVWSILLISALMIGFFRRRFHFKKLSAILDSLSQKYLLPEVMERPYFAEDIAYYQILRRTSKSMLERVTQVKNEGGEYREYIESWVHEVKTPIAAIKLICDNNRTDAARKVLAELEKTENYVEQVLFYARSENVEKDYLIREIALDSPVKNVIVKNKQLFLQNHVAVSLEGLEKRVYSDTKWIEFILNQLLINAIKYRNKENPQIILSASENISGVTLSVYDNGVGILPEDLPRIFEKGFTGQNGRKLGKATGIGLFLCERLCEKLGLQITAHSVPSEYTEFTIFFPKGSLSPISSES